MSTARTWHSGPPPHVGWWNARVIVFGGKDRWGWWGGEKWSAFAVEGDSADFAAKRAATVGADDGSSRHVEWSDYWPEGARVPRIDPAAHARNLQHEADLRLVRQQADMLLALARDRGMSVTIELQPLQPLAMGNTVPVVNVWPKLQRGKNA